MNPQRIIQAEIITIGDEILIGQVVDTNSAWLAQHLNAIGINVFQITSVSDNKSHIINALDQASSRVDLILVTGGLGPTSDDITRSTVAEYFHVPLVRNEEILHHIQKRLEPRGIQLNEINKGQADLPEGCTILHNSQGTAPGMWLEKNNKVFVFMPGVPYEMKAITTEELFHRLTARFSTPVILHTTLMLQGIAESVLAQHIAGWEKQLPEAIKLAYLPSPGIIRLRLSAKGDSREDLELLLKGQTDRLLPLVAPWHFAYNDETLEITVGRLLKKYRKTVSSAESCTGGNIARMITSVAGSSEYFQGTVVAYSNDVKENVLSVNRTIIDNFGAVSQPVVEAMATNVRKLMKTDYAMATSGIAGPDGGTPEKPVGTVWIAVASENQVIAKKFSFGDNHRERNIQRATLAALNELRLLILGENKKN